MSELSFYYIKAPQHQEIRVDGAIGGPGPTGTDIAVSVYTERHPIPQVVVHKMQDNVDGRGQLGPEITEKREGKQGIVRVVQATLYMNLTQAKAVHEWLGNHIDGLERIGEDTK